MLKKVLVIALAGAGMFFGGCQTMTRDSEQQMQKYSRIADLNRRMLAGDIDALLLLDQQSHLTPWHVRSQ